MKPKILLSVCMTSLLTLALIIACGGGGGSDGTSTSSSGETGSVALFITDAPTTDYEEIKLTVSKVTLIPPESEPERSEVTIFPSFKSSEPIEIRLLNLQDQDFLLNVKHNVPAGLYEKIRLYVDKVDVIGGDTCDDKIVKLPSNKLDLNPRGLFEIKAGEVKSIRIDVDAEKSTLLVNAGNSGKCILRPVAFVEIDTFVERCPRILKGTITALFEDNGTTTGFAMELDKGRGMLDVLLDRGQPSLIFDESGMPATSEALAVDQNVKVRGRLNLDADLLASVVVIGDVFALDGTVAGPVTGSLQFAFEIDPGQPIIDPTIAVQLADETLILAGCDTEVGLEAIQEGSRATVVGKLDLSGQLLVAVAVLLREPILAGDLIDIAPSSSDYLLTVRTPAGIDKEVLLPSTEPVLLQNDGVVPFDLLKKLVDCRLSDPLQVKIVLEDPDAETPTALEVRVQTEKIFGTVLAVDVVERTLLVQTASGQIFVQVVNTATILEFVENGTGPDELHPADFESIESGDELSAFGLLDCPDPGDADFRAFVLVFRQIEG